jgi:hypothetical protein
MRKPKKSNKLYLELRQAILSRRLLPGTQLQRETELAEQYGVSRDTLRSALARLEEEALVRRVRGKGTYISHGREMPKITFLLPCPASLHHSWFLTDILGGLMEATHRMDCQVETLALSPTNDPDDIDWSKLLNVNEESRLVVVGFWFSPIFPFLRKSGCRVVFVHDGTFQKYAHVEELSHWVSFEKDQHDIAYRLTKALFRNGCRNPVLFSHYLMEQKQPRVEGVFAAFRENGLQPSEHSFELPPMNAPLKAMKKVYTEARNKKSFDGLLVDDTNLFQYTLLNSTGIKCACFDHHQHSTGILPESACYSEFPLKQMGVDAVTELLKDDFLPFERKYKGNVYDHSGKELT